MVLLQTGDDFVDVYFTLRTSSASVFFQLKQMVIPSAVDRQPWRFTCYLEEVVVVHELDLFE